MINTFKNILVITLFSSIVITAQNQAPEVTNVVFVQRTDNSFLVDIYYDVSDADENTMTISMQVSNDAGSSFDFQVSSLTGDVGEGILSGTNKHIIWDFGMDHPDYISDKIQIKIIANDNVTLQICPPTVTYSGKTYNTILIGDQCWLKENLNVGTIVNGNSNQINNNIIEKYCYDNNELNCDAFGGLYQWDEAMEYNPSDGGTIGATQGICPSGWHIPSHHELRSLGAEVVGSNALKAIGAGTGAGAGTNTSGFSALISGYRWDASNFYGLDERTYFWSSMEEVSITNVDVMMLYYNNNDFYISNHPKTAGSSIRCIMNKGSNQPPNEPSNPTPVDNAIDVNTSIELNWNCTDPDGDNLTYDIYFGTSNNPSMIASSQSGNSYSLDLLENNSDYFWKIIAKDGKGEETEGAIWNFTTKDSTILAGEPCPGIPTVSYAGKTYNTVQIGDQCWLKENLNIGDKIDGENSMSDNNTLEKYCYNNEESNCDIHGGLYQWDEVMQYVTTEGARGICPDGWHVPTKTEFQTLSNTVDGSGNALKSIGQGYGYGIGTNSSGFSALLSGHIWYTNFSDLGSYAQYWSSTGNYYFNLVSNSDSIILNNHTKVFGKSIRCLKD